jgi:hypothetical protein
MGAMKNTLLWVSICCASVIGAVAAETTGPSNLPEVSHAVEPSSAGGAASTDEQHGDSRVRYEANRLQSFTEWWQTPLLVAVCAIVVGFVGYMYRRDSVELKPGFGVLLALLRLAAFVGVLLMFLDIERRSEVKVIRNSRVVMLVDTSLSMSRVDADEAGSIGAGMPRRIDQVTGPLAEGEILKSLRKNHDVEVLKFDSEMRRIAALSRSQTSDATNSNPLTPALSSGEKEPDGDSAEKIDWKKELEPQGAETRVAQAVRQIANEERGAPVSAMVVISDGAQNAGVDTAAAIKAAQEARIPVYTIGIGSATRPTNVRVSDLVAPARAYPGDRFQVTGYVQAQGLAGRTVTVEIAVVNPKEGPNGHEESVWDSTDRVTLGSDSETVPVRFEVPGIDAAGRRVVRLRVKPIAEDKDPTDNQREVDVDIVDRKNRVLLFAGGPTREYQFMRSLLRRSELAKSGEITVDVLLQSAKPGVSQDANEILDEFPHSMQALSQYDTIIAFDPDWKELDPAQLDMVEKWVGEESGGMIVIAGPVFTDAWVQVASMAPIRKLYPVEFNRRLALLEDARYGSTQPWPLAFTREGLEAEFLWLDDNAVASREAWDAFKGVYGYYGVRGPKLGATTYATYSDPEASIGDQKPVYFAGQFYGSGRVFYMGSGEMWRLRDRLFGIFYTKLIRHVSQGRLLRGSALGNLLVERDRYVVGNTVVVRAQLSNIQHQPLDAPKVMLQVTQAGGVPLEVALAADPARKGMFTGQFTAAQEGECKLELLHPDSPDEVLSKRLQVFMPKLEQEHPERNDKLLKELADGTGGQLYIGMPAAFGPQSEKPLVGQLIDKTQETYVSGKKDRVWEEHWMHTLLGLIAGCLCAEWLVRRLCRLA